MWLFFSSFKKKYRGNGMLKNKRFDGWIMWQLVVQSYLDNVKVNMQNSVQQNTIWPWTEAYLQQA